MPIVDVVNNRIRVRSAAPPGHGIRTRAAQRKAEAALVVAVELKNPRVCRACHETKERDEFSSFINRGVRYWHTCCVACRDKRYKRSAAFRAKQAIINSYKTAPCVDCKRNYPPECVRLKARDGQPCFNIEIAANGRTNESIHIEASRSEVVCLNCLATRKKHKRVDISETTSKLAELPPGLRAQVGDMSISPSTS